MVQLLDIVTEFLFDNVLILSVVFVIIYIFWLLINKPFESIKELKDVGYPKYEGISQQIVTQNSKNKPLFSKFPPVYPDGWFMLLESRCLEREEVKHVNALGMDFAVMRASDGNVHVTSAYCTHMGANIAIGGRVVNNSCIQCPFHAWTFDGSTGDCVNIPYSTTGKIPLKSSLKRYHSREVNAHVYVWHHRDDIEPTWEIPVIEQIANGSWKYAGRSIHFMNAHVEESSENGADVHHLDVVHKISQFWGNDLTVVNRSKDGSLGGHRWKVGWECGEIGGPREHIGVMSVEHEMYLMGFSLPLSYANVKATQIGPGIVYLHFLVGGFFEGMLLHHVTPVEPLLQKMTHQSWMKKSLPTFFGKFVLRAEMTQIERDIMIWNNKIYPSNPTMTTDDSFILKHRRWYSKFYNRSAESGTLSPYLDPQGRFVETRTWIPNRNLQRVDEMF